MSHRSHATPIYRPFMSGNPIPPRLAYGSATDTHNAAGRRSPR